MAAIDADPTGIGGAVLIVLALAPILFGIVSMVSAAICQSLIDEERE
ncbi:hypothetical protein [Hyphomicrobium sulfonivorans]|nr:hypothetical protein [Hyphomicrobium sulfonivorans]